MYPLGQAAEEALCGKTASRLLGGGGAQRCMVEYWDTLDTERREQREHKARPTHWRRPLYSTRKAGTCIPNTQSHRPFFGHRVVPSPWSTLISSCFSAARCRTLATNAATATHIGPFGKDFVDGRVMDDRVALGVCRHGQTLPLHPGIEHPQDEVKEPGNSPVCTLASAWASRGAARYMRGNSGSESWTGIASLQALVLLCAFCNGLI